MDCLSVSPWNPLTTTSGASMPVIREPDGSVRCINCDKPIVQGWRGAWLHCHNKFLMMHCYPLRGPERATPPRHSQRTHHGDGDAPLRVG